MTSYGTTNEEYGYASATADTQPTAWQKITHNRWVNLALLLFYLVVLAVVIACIVLISVFHKHLILQCGYAEFIALLGVVSLVVIFSIYHLANIFKFFRRRAQKSSNTGFAAVFDPVLYTDLDDEHFDKQNPDEQAEFEEDDDEDDEEEVEEESKAAKIAMVIAKIFITLLAILGFIALVVFTSVAIPLQQSTLAQWTGKLNLKGFQQQGKSTPSIYRENNGVVHVDASHDYDMYFAQGVAVAQDRLWQLEYNKRLAAGTLSAITGAHVEQDKLSRTLNFVARATADFESFDATTKANINAYVAGINSFYDTNPTLAPEFQYLKVKELSRYTAVDVIAIAKLFAWDISTNGRLELLRYNMLQRGLSQQRVNEFMPRYDVTRFSTVFSTDDLNIHLTPEQIEKIEQDQQDDSKYFMPAYYNDTINVLTSELYNPIMRINSNNWVVNGNFTASKKPLLASDPHLRLTAPGQFHLVHLRNGVDVDAVGASIVGVPGVFIGRNDKISWGITNAEIDGQDFFALEEVVPGTSYKHNGTVYDYKIKSEVIEIAGQPSITIQVRESEFYGPVMNDIWALPGVPLALSWTVLHGVDTSVVGYMSIFRSPNWESFTRALQSNVLGLAYTFADIDNNIGFAVSGRVPLRQVGHSGRFVVRGDGSTDYTGYVNAADMPNVLNPVKGHFVSANNRITPPGFGFSLGQDMSGMYRAERIVQQLFNRTDFDVNKAKDVQRDVQSTLFLDMKPLLEQMKQNVTDDFKPWIEKVLKWDANEALYSQETSVFEMWYSQMGELAKDEIGRRWDSPNYIRNALLHGDAACANKNLTCTEIAAKQFENAVSNLEGTYGSIPLWGSDVHEVEFSHNLLGNTLLKCLAGKIIVNVGGSHTVNEAPVEYPTLGSNYGVVYRQIVDLSATNKDQYIIPLGQSGNFLSPGYDDLLSTWKNGDYLDMNRDGYQGGAKLELASA